MTNESFEWHTDKDALNRIRHGVSFAEAQHAFLDPRRVIAADTTHSKHEQRYFCFGRVRKGILTVRFTWRNGRIRIFGAGFWRRGKQIYEKENPLR